MRVAVDISLYPLDADFVPPIKDVIARLNEHDRLEVWTNAMSTQVVGEFDDVMDALRTEVGATFEQLPKAVVRRWPVAEVETLASDPGALADLPIDHSVPPVFYDGQLGGRRIVEVIDREPRSSPGSARSHCGDRP